MTLQAAAVAAAELGLRVFPLKPRSKEPRQTGGFKSASSDPSYVAGLWSQWPDANIGLDLPPDVVVVDLDSEDGAERVRALGLPPAAAVVRTQRGWQGYYRLPPGRTLRQGPLDGIGDLKSSGSGYTLLPPSVHPEGAIYSFVRGGNESIILATQLSDEHVDALERVRGATALGSAPALPETIPAGQRNQILASLAGSMRRRGSSREAILAALGVENDARCRPPLEQAELEKIAASVSRYAPARDEISFPDDERPTDGFAGWLEALDATMNEDELFAVLTRQRPPSSKLARQQLRGRLITILSRKRKELGSGVSAARTADAWLQEGGADGDLQGQGFVIEETEPWGTSVVGSDVLNEVEALVDAYLFADAEKRDALTLWIVYSHCFESWGVSPIMDLSSPTKRCGKSTGVVVARHLCRAPLLSGNITPAALFRAVEAWKPTLLIDEADTFAKMHDELRGILNAGHTRDTAFVVRAEGDANEPRMFSTWAPKLVAAIGRLPDTIEDRAIRIVLTRKPVEVKKRDAFDPELVRRDCEAVRRRIARFVLDHLDAIATAQAERPDGLNDRAWNNWKPLLAVAAVAGGHWPARAKRAALALSGNGDDGDEEDVGTLALRHTWEVLGPAERLPTAAILTYLVSKDEGPWAKWWEASLAKDELKSPAARLAKLLRPFGIKPQQVWIDGAKTRGYLAEDFLADSVAVYLENHGRDGKDGRTGFSTGAGSTVPTDPTDSPGGSDA